MTLPDMPLPIGGLVLLALLGATSAEGETAIMTNYLDETCYLTVTGPGAQSRNVTLSPGESYEMVFARDSDGIADMCYCRSIWRAVGDCSRAVARDEAEGCFEISENMGCPGRPGQERPSECD